MGEYKFRGSVLPEDLKESIDAYVEHGRPTGGFLEACIDNNLSQAISRADEVSLQALPAVCGYLYNECQASSWGKAGSFKSWIELKRKERVAQ